MNNTNIENKLKKQYTNLTENIRKKLQEIKNLSNRTAIVMIWDAHWVRLHLP